MLSAWSLAECCAILIPISQASFRLDPGQVCLESQTPTQVMAEMRIPWKWSWQLSCHRRNFTDLEQRGRSWTTLRGKRLGQDVQSRHVHCKQEHEVTLAPALLVLCSFHLLRQSHTMTDARGPVQDRRGGRP